MKKSLLKTLSSLLLFTLLFSGCKKVTEKELMSENPLTGKEEPGQANAKDGDNSCRLQSLVTGTGYQELISYNNKGLANRWYIDYGGGDTYDYHFTYDSKGKLVSSQEIFWGGTVDYTFYSDGKHITRATGRLQPGGELFSDIFYVYNNKGQMISLDDVPADIHSRFFYDNKGYNRKSDFYVGTDLVYTLFLNFNINNKNPYLALKGIDFGFVSYIFVAPQFDQRWNSDGSWVVYEEGNPIVIAEDDPAQTVIHTGQGNYATYAKYFDIPSSSFYDMTFTYSCNDQVSDNKSPVPSVKKSGPMTVKTRLQKILNSRSKNMKQELLSLKAEFLQKNNAKRK